MMFGTPKGEKESHFYNKQFKTLWLNMELSIKLLHIILRLMGKWKFLIRS